MMHPILTRCLFILWSPLAMGQTAQTDTSYLDKFGTTTRFADSAAVVVVITGDSPGIKAVKENWYTPKGQLIAEHDKKILSFYARHGNYTYYYPNGKVFKRIEFKDGFMDGAYRVYAPNGKLIQKDIYSRDTFKTATRYDANGQPLDWDRFYSPVRCQGGNDSLNRFILRHIRYPDIARENNIEGRVFVAVHVAADGKRAYKVIRGVHNSLDKEALRVIRNLPPFQPATEDGKPVDGLLVVGILFRLDYSRPYITSEVLYAPEEEAD